MMPPPTERKSMGQIDVTSKSRTKQRAGGVKARIENFLEAFEWTWTRAVTFSLALVFFLLISTAVMPSFWMYFAEQKIGWARPHRHRGVPACPLRHLDHEPAVPQGYLRSATRSRWASRRCRSSWCWWCRPSCRTGGASSAAASGDARPTGGYR